MTYDGMKYLRLLRRLNGCLLPSITGIASIHANTGADAALLRPIHTWIILQGNIKILALLIILLCVYCMFTKIRLIIK